MRRHGVAVTALVVVTATVVYVPVLAATAALAAFDRLRATITPPRPPVDVSGPHNRR